MKKLLFLKYFVFAFAFAQGQSLLMAVDGQETHKNLNPNVYEIKDPKEYKTNIFDAIPNPHVTVYYEKCGKDCYAANVSVSAKVARTQLMHQLNIINAVVGGKLLNGKFDISNPESVNKAAEIVLKYGRVVDVDFQNGSVSLLGVKNDFSGGNGWITYNNVAIQRHLVLDFSAVAGFSPYSSFPIAKADCLNNDDDDATMAIWNRKANIVHGSGSTPNPQSNVPVAVAGGGTPGATGSNNVDLILALAKLLDANKSNNIAVATGGTSSTATPPAASSCGCPNPNVQSTPPAVTFEQSAQPSYIRPQQPLVQQQPAMQGQMMIQTSQGQMMVPQGSYAQGNTLYSPDGRILAELNSIRQASIATATGTWANVAVTTVLGILNRVMPIRNNTYNVYGTGGTLTGGQNWTGGTLNTTGGGTTLSGRNYTGGTL